MKLGQTDSGQNMNVRLFDGTNTVISVGPKHYEGETESLQSHFGETEIPIGETDLPRVCGSGYDI